MSLYWALRAAFALAPRIPLPWQYRLGALGGEAVYWCWPSKRRNTRRNMAVVAGDDPGSSRADNLARASLRNYGRYVVDFFNMPSLPVDELVARIDVHGWEHLDSALAVGRGVIFVAGHFGTYDYAPLVLAHRYPGRVYAVAEPFTPPRMDELIQGQRMAKGAGIIPMASVRRMVRVLRDNHILALLVDRPAHNDGIPVEFFGRKTMVPAGAATLAALTGATVLPGYLIRRDDGGFDAHILPPVSFMTTGNRADDVRRLTQVIFTALERMIVAHPQHWYMFRDMWGHHASALEEVEVLA